jgi:hypothetical protein
MKSKLPAVLIAAVAVVIFFGGATLVNLTNQVTGTLPHGNGGTDVTSPGSAGNGLRSNGTSWASAQFGFSDLSGSATAAQLPNPSSSTLGGIESFAAVTHQWIRSISTSGVPAASQPACGDLSDATVCNTATNGSGNVVLTTSPALVTPSLGAATATSLLSSGIVDGLAPLTVTTGASATLGGTYKSGYIYNQEATAGTAVVYTLPTAAAGLQYCVGNSYNGSAGDTGTLKVLTSASGQFIIYNGALSATNGYVISGGALGDKGCVVGVDSTHWEFYAQVGTWTLH